MDRKEQLEAVETMQNLLIARATGSVTASDSDYRSLRNRLLAESVLRDILPSFLRTARDLSQFWAYIKKDFTGYEKRREHIWSAFQPVFEFLEAPEETAPFPEQVSTSLATVAEVAATKSQTTRVFISYSTKEKATAAKVKDFLVSYRLKCFLAHEDLQVSEEWKERILEELLHCHIFIPLLSKSFRESEWAPQEIGVIAGRKTVAIVPIALDSTVPFGFISNIQGRTIPLTGLNEDLIITPLLKKCPRLIIPCMIERVRGAKSYRNAEAAMKPLAPYFGSLTGSELLALVDASIENDQVWSAGECRVDLLPKLIAANTSRISPDKLRALSYQIENNREFQVEL
ncbi:MAG: toll/interleukin-1 receptor domain-containing protein [Nitrospira sp.]